MKRKLKYDDDEVACKKKCLNDSVELNGNGHSESSSTSQLDYDPVHFLRCHSRNNDVADVQTQVWQCAFEPDPYRQYRTTDIVATCGGNSVCFINVKEGEVVGKYYAEDKTEMFYSLAWTTLRNSWMNEGVRANILAVGGAKSTIHLIHHANSVAFLKMTLKKGKKLVINSLLFHPLLANILFCANSEGDIVVLDIGTPLPPDYSPKSSQLYMLSHKSEVISLAFSIETGMLLAACSEGLAGWKVGSKELKKLKNTSDKFELVEFTMPNTKSKAMGEQTTKLVDSVEVLEEGLVATKCALSGNIYIWNIKESLSKGNYNVEPTHVLRWSDTDNYFMYMGYHRSAGLLACGDDKGALWLYNIHDLLRGGEGSEGVEVDPDLILAWPALTDTYIDKKRKLSLDVYDIVVDKVAIHHEGEYIVAVTSNNMVCIWKRTSSPV
ncbi:leucine-rich repeat and WD repeat-containing protein 1 [Anabrus simplex]|uniref:leucine-rich repeat and WD repeat-containing protein 1 n=1 Tax=Anabrus simplex TaxID=316456 RepID=UPI0034DD900D